MLVAFGEFLRNNQPMLGACWCEEWWIETIRNSEKYQSFSDEEKESFDLESLQTKKFTAEEAFKYTDEFNVPLHPEYTYYYNDISIKDLVDLSQWLDTQRDYLETGYQNGEDLELDLSYQKRILEVMGLLTNWLMVKSSLKKIMLMPCSKP
jgi:DNA polymerase II large subunit